MKRLSMLFLSLFMGISLFAQEMIKPSGTYCFATRDSEKLYLDVYDPAPGSETVVNGKQKPTVIFVFGGGFMMGKRNSASYDRWFRLLTQNGYRVVANDYRLGLKGVRKMGVGQVALLEKAVNMAVEDLFSATAFLIENASTLGIDPDNIVVSGSSAGAITALQAEWYICDSNKLADMLPEGFNYAGVMSFAGAIYSKKGAVKFAKSPAPVLLFHGKDDKIVNYNQIWFFNHRFEGSNVLVKALRKGGFNYSVYRYDGYGHEISGIMARQIGTVDDFLKTNVMAGEKRIVDADVNDPSINHFKAISNLDDLYAKPLPKGIDL